MTVDELLKIISEKHQESLHLLDGCRNIFAKIIGHCLNPRCSLELPCQKCEECKNIYKKIDEHLEDNGHHD